MEDSDNDMYESLLREKKRLRRINGLEKYRKKNIKLKKKVKKEYKKKILL